mgnify:FL=1
MQWIKNLHEGIKMSSSVKKNLFYSLLYQIVTTALPLITVPYVSRVLQANGIGIYTFTFSITQYFILFGTLGLTLYGNRQIAYTRDDKEKLSKTFWSILFLRIITIGFAAILYVIIFFRIKEYKEIYMVQTINIVAAILDISWLYTGIEDFKKTVTRNLIVRIVGVCFIFAFVKTKDDLMLYVLINGLTSLLGNILLWFYIPGIVNKVKLHRNEILIHLLPSIKLFIPQVAMQVYVVLDKTMLGLLSNLTEVGYYEQSEKVVKISLNLITILGTVMLPRVSNLFAKGEDEKIKNYLNFSLRGVACVAIPLTFGIISITDKFVPWFFGTGFEPVKYIIPLLSPILYLIATSNVIGIQYLLPTNKTREFTISVTSGAIVNLLMNLVLIPKFGAIGACLGTLSAELTVTLVQYKYINKDVDIRYYFEGIKKYIITGVIMLLVVKMIGYTLNPNIITTVFQIFMGTFVYIVGLIILREEYSNSLVKSLTSSLKKGYK